jgi:anti-sigma factor RsiW
MKCNQVYLHICDNLDQKIDSPRCRQIRTHLDTCPDCRAYLESLKKTVTFYRALPVPNISRKAHRELFSTIRSMTRQPAKSKRAAK